MSENTPREDAPQGDPTAVVPPPPPANDPTAEVPAPPAPAEPVAAPEPPTPPAPAPGWETPATGEVPPPPPEPQYAAPQAVGGPPAYQQPYPTTGAGSSAPMSPQEEKTWGMAAHGIALAATVFSGGFLSFVAALVMYLVVRDRGPFVRAHTANALNVQIIVGIVFIVSIPLMFVLVGFLTFAAAWVFAVIVHIVGMVKANNGEWWDPPLTPKFVR
ncbi:DUF4870 domain-containing protein [Phycicoccus sonneratiae]|nr:DUF4870 domain-containing protein [Phycicoccus sonneraticus]